MICHTARLSIGEVNNRGSPWPDNLGCDAVKIERLWDLSLTFATEVESAVSSRNPVG
jgi:hypothetical protein